MAVYRFRTCAALAVLGLLRCDASSLQCLNGVCDAPSEDVTALLQQKTSLESGPQRMQQQAVPQSAPASEAKVVTKQPAVKAVPAAAQNSTVKAAKTVPKEKKPTAKKSVSAKSVSAKESVSAKSVNATNTTALLVEQKYKRYMDEVSSLRPRAEANADKTGKSAKPAAKKSVSAEGKSAKKSASADAKKTVSAKSVSAKSVSAKKTALLEEASADEVISLRPRAKANADKIGKSAKPAAKKSVSAKSVSAKKSVKPHTTTSTNTTGKKENATALLVEQKYKRYMDEVSSLRPRAEANADKSGKSAKPAAKKSVSAKSVSAKKSASADAKKTVSAKSVSAKNVSAKKTALLEEASADEVISLRPRAKANADKIGTSAKPAAKKSVSAKSVSAKEPTAKKSVSAKSVSAKESVSAKSVSAKKPIDVGKQANETALLVEQKYKRYMDEVSSLRPRAEANADKIGKSAKPAAKKSVSAEGKSAKKSASADAKKTVSAKSVSAKNVSAKKTALLEEASADEAI